MGYPASAALLFKALTEKEDSWLHEDAKNLVNKFSLFAIILADPVKDPLFYDHIQTNFPFYDRLTGKNFMFFSIIKAKDIDSFDGAHKRFKIFNDTDAYKQNHAAEETIHSELAIHAVCTILGINYDETPCLILSDNLRFGQFCKITTGINQLEKQLIALRSVADYVSTQSGVPSLLQLLTKFNEPGSYFEDIESLEIFPDTIPSVSKILQLISSEGMFSSNTYLKLLNDFYSDKISSINPVGFERKQMALGLLGSVKKSRNGNSPHISMALESLVNYSKNVRFNENVSGKIADSERLLIEWNDIQPSTKNYLTTSLFMEKNMMQMFRSQDDYSLYAIPLCKSFETEITYSAVQLIRKYLGVNMPEYFSRYCPATGKLPITPLATLVHEPREIYFNIKKNDGKWIPPGLGEARLGFATLKNIYNDFAEDWQPQDKVKILLDQWKIIQNVRNKSAHMEPVNELEKKRLEEGLTQLHSANLLNALTALKVSLNS